MNADDIIIWTACGVVFAWCITVLLVIRSEDRRWRRWWDRGER